MHHRRDSSRSSSFTTRMRISSKRKPKICLTQLFSTATHASLRPMRFTIHRHCVHYVADLSDVKDALVCVLTCRCSNSAKDDEVQCKVNRVKLQVSKIKQYAPNCIIVIADEPVDLLSYVAWKTSEFEPNKIIGVGTMLDNVRLRSLVANRLKNQIRASDVQSFVVGQAGCNSGK
uniref:Lactate/malate dehydrogenase N-terminal domain-containing protein n=1 Tax=Trichogramma kaykai TaxID=54128 RepID=A0ABD2WGJ8_9HYME